MPEKSVSVISLILLILSIVIIVPLIIDHLVKPLEMIREETGLGQVYDVDDMARKSAYATALLGSGLIVAGLVLVASHALRWRPR